MSLIKLLKWHKFTLQTSEGAGQEPTGAYNRRDSWINVEGYINASGHLQSTPSNKLGKDDTTLAYGKDEFELYYTLFHNNVNLFKLATPDHRILIHKDPKEAITNFKDALNIRIFEVVSSREPVSLRKRNLALFELFMKQTFRQSL